MKKKLLIILTNELEEYDSFFSSLKESGIFHIQMISYEKIFSLSLKNLLKETRFQNLLIAFHAPMYEKIGDDIHKYLKRLFNPAINNFIYFFKEPELVSRKDLFSGSKFLYCLPREHSAREVINFSLFLTRAFSENTISYRLYDYITNSFRGTIDRELMEKKNEEIKRLMEEVERKSRIDGLTNLFNRATIYKYLEQERRRTNRGLWRIDKALKDTSGINTSLHHGEDFDSEPVGELLDHYGVLSVMMIDVDHFKEINDTHGHLIGDKVLVEIGHLLQNRDIFRDNDVAGRFGGEEFLVILPDTNVNNALGPALRFARQLSRIEFTGNTGAPFYVTVSIGISQSSVSDHNNDDIVKRSDDALYFAKKNGRNRVAIYERVFKN